MQKLQLIILGHVIFFCMITSGQNKDSTATLFDTDDSIYQMPVKEVKMLIYKTYGSDKDLALQYSIGFLEQGIHQENYNIQQYASMYISYIYYNKSKYRKALTYTEISIEAATKIEDSLKLVDSYILQGGIYMRLANYNESLKSYLKAEKIAIDKGLKNKELICIANIGFVRIELKRYSDALEVLEKVISKLEKEEYRDTKKQFEHTYIRVILSKGLCLKELNRLDEALLTYQEGTELANTYDLKNIKGNFYINTGDVFYEKGEYHKALGYLNEGKKILKSVQSSNFSNILLAEFYSARCLFKLEKLKEALDLLIYNFGVIKENNIQKTDKLHEMYELAIHIAEQLEDRNLIISLNQDYRETFSKISEDQLKARDVLYNRDISKLKIDNESLVARYDKKKYVTAIAIGIASILLLVLVFMFFRFKIKSKENEKRFQKLAKSIKEKSFDNHQKTIKKDSIKDEKVNSILEELNKLQDSLFFLSEECNLYTTAKKINTNTTYLSKTINTYKKQSFNQYLNELRIHHVILKLHDNAKFRSYTIEAIAQEVGYKSSNTFVKAFKDKTNLNPSFYIKCLDKSENFQST
ncbi:helix-turn-helix domain-containing protein [Aquimarina megaterium]|uniref:helix-turn-helix domain-containing protein n=1 Tax=Aquimarina megaterium TaxID=1443666 RepID=UPI0009F3C488|nr:helix-turn-helix domain-containing protein [Aquimarina megaterium]